MSRVIKFRTFAKTEGHYLDAFTQSFGVALAAYVTGAMCNLDQRVEFEEKLILEQWTGLLDSTGREIYEGDIVEQPWLSVINGEVAKGLFRDVVRWVDEIGFCAARWGICAPDSNRGPDLIGSQSQILGNIHEHPELLKS